MTENPRIEALRRRVEKDPASIAFAQLAEEYRRAGDYEQAIRICREGLARHPGYLSAQVTLGRALIELGQFDEARAELEAVVSVAPDNLAAIRALADIHQRHGDSDVVSLPATIPEPTETAPQPTDLVPPQNAPADQEDIATQNASTEAAGVVITPTAVTDALPAPDLSEWTVDAEVPADNAPLGSVDTTSVPASDPVIEALEQWLTAIVADRAISR